MKNRLLLFAIWFSTVGNALAALHTQHDSSVTVPSKKKEPAPKAQEVKKNTQTPDLQPLQLYEKFTAEKILSIKGVACIRDPKCPSDESDYLRHAEAAYAIQKQLESMAKKGNHDAGYLVGLIAYEQARSFDEEFQIYSAIDDVEYRKSAVRFVDLSRREIRRAKEFLWPVAKAMKPEACYLLGEVLEFEQGKSPGNPALTYFYCAAREWHLKGQRELAMRAYSGMRRTGKAQDPMVIEMHAKLLDDQPFNPWRPIGSK